MKQPKKTITIIIINLVLLLILAEVAGLITYYRKEGAFFYSRGAKESPIGIDKELTASIGDPLSSKLLIHPVLGYIQRPGVNFKALETKARLSKLFGDKKALPAWTTKTKTNNFGYTSAYDYPFVPKGDKTKNYIVGIFGGSVANYLTLQGGERLKEELKKIPALKDKEIIVLNFAQPSFKEPQQVLSLQYFLLLGQEFDFILNLDGFNEIALSLINKRRGIDESMPDSEVMLNLKNFVGQTSLDFIQIEGLYRVMENKKRLLTLDARMEECGSALFYGLLSVKRKRAEKAYWMAAAKLDELSARTADDKDNIIYLNKPLKAATETDAVFKLWERSSLFMQRIASNNNVPYLEVVQPNQYFTSKELTNEEKRTAIFKESTFREAIAANYPLLTDWIPSMRSRGVNIISAVNVFDDRKESIYIDTCCHVNQLGNEILADLIAKEMSPLIEKQARGK